MGHLREHMCTHEVLLCRANLALQQQCQSPAMGSSQVHAAPSFVFYHCRRLLPAADAPAESWAEFVGVPPDTTRPLSFLLFSDPRFTQLYKILEGMDYHFPRATKLGKCRQCLIGTLANK